MTVFLMHKSLDKCGQKSAGACLWVSCDKRDAKWFFSKSIKRLHCSGRQKRNQIFWSFNNSHVIFWRYLHPLLVRYFLQKRAQFLGDIHQILERDVLVFFKCFVDVFNAWLAAVLVRQTI